MKNYLNQLFVNKLRANDASFNNVDINEKLSFGSISNNIISFGSNNINNDTNSLGLVTQFKTPRLRYESELRYVPYLGRLDLLYLDSQGNFLIRKGIPAEAPRWPQTDNVSMLIA